MTVYLRIPKSRRQALSCGLMGDTFFQPSSIQDIHTTEIRNNLQRKVTVSGLVGRALWGDDVTTMEVS